MLAFGVFLNSKKKDLLQNVNNSTLLKRKRGEYAVSNSCHRKDSLSRICCHFTAVDAPIGLEYYAKINDAL